MRVLTYNIRRGLGSDGAVSLRRIARVVERLEPDVAGLNEVWRLPLVFDTPKRLARNLRMEHVFQRNVELGRASRYGNLILSRGDVLSHVDLKLPGKGEQRGALFCEVDYEGTPIVFCSTHLGLSRSARTEQLAAIAEALPDDIPVVVSGDLNARDDELGVLLERLDLVPPVPTYPAMRPRAAIDHVLYSDHFELVGATVVRTLASDHLPVVADLRLRVTHDA